MNKLITTCFSCGKEMGIYEEACPHCGYKFIADEETYCPNRVAATCSITGKLCNMGMRYMDCEIKNNNEEEDLW